MTLINDIFSIRDSLMFSADTAVSGTISDVPSAGHCAVTAIIIQMILGGELVSAYVCDQSHWFNRIEGYDIDATADQFKGNRVLMTSKGVLYPGTRVRHHVEIDEVTWQRAKLLASRSGIHWTRTNT